MSVLRKLRLAATCAALLLLAASCRTAPPAVSGSGRVILISLDGASAVELHRRYQAGELRAGGFSRFFEEGQVGSSLSPVDPTLTAVNHISLATGFPPAATGIVSNNFRVAGSPWGEGASGFSALIGTETLWEAAKRQGKRAGVWTFPGADDTSPRRRGDWGLTYVGKALHPAAQVDLSRASFQPVEDSTVAAGLPPHFGPALSATVQGTGENDGGRAFRLVALDGRDDGREAYEDLYVAPASPKEGAPERIVPGGWCRVASTDPKLGPTASWLELEELAPDLSRVRLYLGAEYGNQVYPPEFAADLAAQGLIWPGPPDDDAFEATWDGKPGIDLAAWIDQTVRFGDFFYDGLAFAARRPDWDLLLGYVPTIDEGGHELLLEEPRQPGYTSERRDAFAAAREKIWQGADRGLARLLAAVDLKTTTVLIASDHGMTPVFARIDPNAVIVEAGFAKIGPDGKVDPAASKALAISNGGVSHVYLAPVVPASERAAILTDLSRRFMQLAVNGERGIDRAFTHAQLGPLGLDHPNSGDLVLFAHAGFTFAEKPLPSGAITAPTDVYGMHGHLYQGGKGDPRLAGIYLALGRGVEKRTLGVVKNTDVAPRAAGYLGIEPPRRVP
ncbi:MAG TPA: alkaline phosphatase family protein [Thermoanaerobaculia bacterium]|jgi:hypothetical protein|nr:alkaline phosphatase family protein [Thermoanaerobaculia bacterium]